MSRFLAIAVLLATALFVAGCTDDAKGNEPRRLFNFNRRNDVNVNVNGLNVRVDNGRFFNRGQDVNVFLNSGVHGAHVRGFGPAVFVPSAVYGSGFYGSSFNSFNSFNAFGGGFVPTGSVFIRSGGGFCH